MTVSIPGIRLAVAFLRTLRRQNHTATRLPSHLI
jgi:hypothetical protein